MIIAGCERENWFDVAGRGLLRGGLGQGKTPSPALWC